MDFSAGEDNAGIDLHHKTKTVVNRNYGVS
jgi:hypothetical protein